MSGFVAAEAAEPLDYDLTAYVADCKGTIPEPSREAIRAFFHAFGVVAAQRDDLRASDDFTPTEDRTLTDLVTARMAASDALADKELDAVVALCAGSPSRADLEALPGRMQQLFVGWLWEKFTNPQPTAATRPSLAVVPND